MSPNAKRETTVLDATTEGLAFHDVWGDVQNLVGSGHDSDNDSAPQAA